jgi:hypothetical protein
MTPRIPTYFLLLTLVAGCVGETPTATRTTDSSQLFHRESKTIALGNNRLFPGQFQLRHVIVSEDPTQFNFKLSGDYTVLEGTSVEVFLMYQRDVQALIDGTRIERVWQSGVASSNAWEFSFVRPDSFTFVLDNRVGEPEWKTIRTRLILSWDQL